MKDFITNMFNLEPRIIHREFDTLEAEKQL